MSNNTQGVASPKATSVASIQFQDGNGKTDQAVVGTSTIVDVQMWDTAGNILKCSGATVPTGTITNMAVGGTFLLNGTGAEYKNIGTIAAGVLSAGSLQQQTTVVSSAQLLALFTTPVVVVSAPAAGTYIQLISVSFTYKYNSIAYTINGSTNLTLNITNASGTALTAVRATTGIIDQTADVQVNIALSASNIIGTATAPIALCLATANPTVGNGTLVVNCVYRVVLASG